jgi:hypothetical protein
MNKRNTKKNQERIMLNKLAVADNIFWNTNYYKKEDKKHIFNMVQKGWVKLSKVKYNKQLEIVEIECKDIPESLNDVVEFVTASDDSIIVVPGRFSKEVAFKKAVQQAIDWGYDEEDLDIKYLKKESIGFKKDEEYTDFIMRKDYDKKCFSHKSWVYEL